MGAVTYIKLEDVDSALATYNRIQVERSATAEGVYTLIATLTLTAGDAYYSYDDDSGTENSWYRYRLFHSVTLAASGYSNPQQPQTHSLRRIRQKLITTYKAGMVFLANGSGLTTRVATDDWRIKVPIYPVGRGKNSFLYKSEGTNSGQTRFITTSNPTSGYFDVSPALSSIPSANDEFEWHWLVPPDEINKAINRGLRRYWYIDRIPITGVGGTDPYTLSEVPWLTQKRQITGLWYTPDDGVSEHPYNGAGRWWNITQDAGHWQLLIPYLTVGQVVYLETLRNPLPLNTDASKVDTQLNTDLIAAFGYDEILTQLIEGGFAGTSIDREAWRIAQRKHRENDLDTLIQMHKPEPRYALPVTSTPSSIPRPYTAR